MITDTLNIYDLYSRIGGVWKRIGGGQNIEGDAISQLPISKADAWVLRTTLIDSGFSPAEVTSYGDLLLNAKYSESEVQCGQDMCTRTKTDIEDAELILLCKADGFCPLITLRIPDEVYTIKQSDPIFRPLDPSLFDEP